MHRVFLLLLLVCEATWVWGQERYPVIHNLDISDIIFRQLEEDISQYYFDVQNGRNPPPLVIFAYHTKEGDDLFDLAARCNLPYDTIATLNGLSSATTFSPGTLLLLASTPGLFVPLQPASELEYLMASWRRASGQARTAVNVYRGTRRESFFFYPGQRFHPVERAYFLGIFFRFPLPKGVITSPFGMRRDPFTHLESFHPGIDIAAPYGTDVFAARGGYVQKVGTDRELGNYIMLRHEGGYESLYAHLSDVLVRLNERVASGMIIGKVGSTGMSTGPHLHFEILRNGRPEDPLPLLPKGGG